MRCKAYSYKNANNLGRCKSTVAKMGRFYGVLCKSHAHQLWTAANDTKRFRILTLTLQDLTHAEIHAVFDELEAVKGGFMDWVSIRSLTDISWNRYRS
jgi:hypothetical protein